MSTAARKARKRAGIPFTKAQKVGTPVWQRAWFNAIFPGVAGTRHQLEQMPRSAKKRLAALAARSVEVKD